MRRMPLRAALAAAVTAMLALPMTGAAQATPTPPGTPVTVMTRNLYLGADINRPVEAALDAEEAGGTPQQVVAALAVATHVSRTIVDQTDFPTRSRLLAAEIARTKPDLVGLQEVALWRSGPLELDKVGVPNATVVDYDFLEILLDDLADAGTPYEAVVVGQRADVESPSFSPTMANPRDVRLTMRDVILRRAGGSVKVSDHDDEIFTNNLPVVIAGVQLNFSRGYQWADVRVGATSFRFVNTHLEAFSSDLALAQAVQMVNEATASDRTTILVCDCNSDPLLDEIKPIDTVPHKAPYEFLRAAGYQDLWLHWAPAHEGWTSGLSELVNDPTPAGFDHRIDMVFAHTVDGHQVTVDRGEVTGDELTDRDPATGLWPSDHAGVVLRLRHI
ncbi:MAG: endonuclease/exonuclease/phosphatase [Ornithinibacter sp.]|nr:endonuclease/exonuclease/phosphatase [Ornithinibacter sp.]